MSGLTMEKRIERMETGFSEMQKGQTAIVQSVGDLATITKNMAEHVYSEEEEDQMALGDPLMGNPTDDPMIDDKMGGMHHKQEEEEYPMLEDVPANGDPMMDKGGMYRKNEHMGEEEELLDEELQMADPSQGNFQRGYAGTAKTRSSEEDSPFGDTDSTVAGNEPQPAGDMGGDREDETFNAKFMAVQADLRDLRGRYNQMQRAKAISPPVGDMRKSQRIGGGGSPQGVTRQMQVEAKSRSWAELNQLRTATGDLPSFGV